MLGLAFKALRYASRLDIKSKPWESSSLANIYVIDGDTLEADVVKQGSTFRTRIRIMGYDAYEQNEDKGPIATRFLQNILQEDEFFLRTQWDKDKYGRLLGHLLNSEGLTVAAIFKAYQLSKT